MESKSNFLGKCILGPEKRGLDFLTKKLNVDEHQVQLFIIFVFPFLDTKVAKKKV